MRKISPSWKFRPQRYELGKTVGQDSAKKILDNTDTGTVGTVGNKQLFRHSMKALSPSSVPYNQKPATCIGKRL
jgi:hypothetical protein